MWFWARSGIITVTPKVVIGRIKVKVSPGKKSVEAPLQQTIWVWGCATVIPATWKVV
jgi:hypothetical protein